METGAGQPVWARALIPAQAAPTAAAAATDTVETTAARLRRERVSAKEGTRTADGKGTADQPGGSGSATSRNDRNRLSVRRCRPAAA